MNDETNVEMMKHQFWAVSVADQDDGAEKLSASIFNPAAVLHCISLNACLCLFLALLSSVQCCLCVCEP